MTITPFLALQLRGKKDAIRARQRARRVAGLLHFELHDQTCIAAGAFLIACQALELFGKSRLCFQIENQRLQVFAEADSARPRSRRSEPQRLAGMLGEVDPKRLYRLTKPLPANHTAEEADLAWLVEHIEEAATSSLFDEVVKQNQEVLALLHELRLYQGSSKQSGEKPVNPHAA